MRVFAYVHPPFIIAVEHVGSAQAFKFVTPVGISEAQEMVIVRSWKATVHRKQTALDVGGSNEGSERSDGKRKPSNAE